MAAHASHRLDARRPSLRDGEAADGALRTRSVAGDHPVHLPADRGGWHDRLGTPLGGRAHRLWHAADDVRRRVHQSSAGGRVHRRQRLAPPAHPLRRAAFMAGLRGRGRPGGAGRRVRTARAGLVRGGARTAGGHRPAAQPARRTAGGGRRRRCGPRRQLAGARHAPAALRASLRGDARSAFCRSPWRQLVRLCNHAPEWPGAGKLLAKPAGE